MAAILLTIFSLMKIVVFDEKFMFFHKTLLWRWRLKSPASRMFTQPSVQAKIKENIEAPRHWPLWEEFTGDRWIPRTKGQ